MLEPLFLNVIVNPIDGFLFFCYPYCISNYKIMGQGTKEKKSRNKSIFRRHNRGERSIDIAEYYGLSRQRVWEIVRRYVRGIDKK
jgi:hypothetical protein